MKTSIELMMEAEMAVLGDVHLTLDDVERLIQVVRADEREACANIDWTPILRNGGIVTWGDAETLADLVSAAIQSRRPA